MKTIRLTVALAGALLMAAGYFASQIAYFSGRAVNYAESIDQSAVRLLALVLLGGALILGSIAPPEEAH